MTSAIAATPGTPPSAGADAQPDRGFAAPLGQYTFEPTVPPPREHTSSSPRLSASAMHWSSPASGWLFT